MNDLMGNVKGSGAGFPLPPLYAHEGERVSTPQDNNDKDLPQFFSKVDEIKELLSEIRSLQKKIGHCVLMSLDDLCTVSMPGSTGGA